MPGWDYSGNGVYFITLVTQNRECHLGEIIIETHGFVETHGRASLRNNRTFQKKRAYIKLSDFGKIVDDEWNKSFEIRHELHCDEYIIMPNHLHAIVVLKKPKSGNFNDSTDLHGSDESVARPQIFRKPKSLSSFIGGFKSAINTKIDNYIDENHLDIPKYNRNNHFFQPNFHDRIIRDEKEYYRIKNYIINNPLNWNNDKFNS